MTELSRATVGRLPHYLRLLDDRPGHSDTVNSEDLAEAAGVNAANVRRDLSDLGFRGTRGVGYSAPALADRIRFELGIHERRRVAIVGAGNLGTALARYTGLAKNSFDVTAIYDIDRKRVGASIGDIRIQHSSDMSRDCSAGCFEMAILAVPAAAAQNVADQLVKSGIRSILNFAPSRVGVPKSVAIRHVDLSTELQVLNYYGLQ